MYFSVHPLACHLEASKVLHGCVAFVKEISSNVIVNVLPVDNAQYMHMDPYVQEHLHLHKAEATAQAYAVQVAVCISSFRQA